MSEDRKIIFNERSVLFALNRKCAGLLGHGRVQMYEGIAMGVKGDHQAKVINTRRAKNKVARKSRKANRHG